MVARVVYRNSFTMKTNAGIFFKNAGLLGLLFFAAEVSQAETLYNGIELPAVWPPTNAFVPDEPMSVPYLAKPPAVIPIDLGRQLFVDDFLIESTTLRRVFHRLELFPENPVVRPDQVSENAGRGAMAMVFSDGVWFDTKDQLFKMWYMNGYAHATSLALSRDGIHWDKPPFDVKPGSNMVQPGARDSSTVWLDLEEKDPARRFKMFRSHGAPPDGRFGLSIHASADGIHWSEPLIRTGSCGDRTTVFWNPFRKVWVYSLRHGWGQPRARRYWENTNLFGAHQWTRIDEPPMWIGADRLDPPREDLKVKPQLYNLDGVAYESLILGLFTIWRGDLNIPPGRPKPNEVCLGFSRDGYHWDRPDRKPFVTVSEKKGDWNWGNVQSAGGGCLVVGDKLYFYFSGRAGLVNERDAGGSTGLGFLRRDGFASMDAAPTPGTLVTRPIRFHGRHLFVNANVAGELRAELVDSTGLVLTQFSKEKCQPFHGDKTLAEIRWRGSEDISGAADRAVRIRFYVDRGSLYSFWVSADESGASHGYVAAGGPGFTGPTDTAGLRAIGLPK